MDETKGYHSEISYENTAGLLSVNLYTKRVLYTGNTITMGSNLHNMNVSLVYNSLFELPFGDETGLGKKWKLDVEEYLYEYSDFYIYVNYTCRVRISVYYAVCNGFGYSGFDVSQLRDCWI